MKSSSEKYRIVLSRIVIGVGLFFVCSTQSYWETENELMTFGLFFVGLVLVAIASLGRMWCSLYIAGHKNSKLVMDGPYSLCRNPLYFFSMIGMVGVGCTTETLTFPILLTVFFALYYPMVIRSEAVRLREIFGPTFDEYIRKVPEFFPRFSNFVEPQTYVVNPAVYRNHIFSALWFIWIVGILEVVEGLRDMGVIDALWTAY